LVQSGNEVLEIEEIRRLPDPGNLVLEAVRETFIVKADKGGVIPASAAGMAVKLEGVLQRVLVAEGLESGRCIVDRVSGTKEALEFR
jgi:hypothetical protein